MSKGTVLLVNPWIVDFAAYDFWIKPAGLLSIAAVLRENGYETLLLDCMDRNHPALLRSLRRAHAGSRPDGTGNFLKEILPKPPVLAGIPRRYGRYGLPLPLVRRILARTACPDLILVTSGMTYWYPGVREMIGLLRERFPGVPVLLGGIYASLATAHAESNSGADLVLPGPGEGRILEIVGGIAGPPSGAGGYGSLDDLPDPWYGGYARLDSAAILTSRGCPYRCPFCASHLLTDGYAPRRPERVVGEIARLHTERGVTEFAFYDDALLHRKDSHLLPILEGLIDRGLPLHFHTPNGVPPGEIDAAAARLMRRAGFRTIRLSYETGNRKGQRSRDGEGTGGDLARAAGHFLEAGFSPFEMGVYVMMGMPGQPVGEVVDSVRFVLGLGIGVHLASYSPIPGTACREEAVAAGLMGETDDPLLSNSSVFPLHRDDGSYDTYLRLGTAVKTANGLLRGTRGASPAEEAVGFVDRAMLGKDRCAGSGPGDRITV